MSYRRPLQAGRPRMSTLSANQSAPVVESTAPRIRSGLFGTSALVLGARVLGLGLSFIAGVVVARLLGPHRLGQYETAMSWAALLAIPAGAGIEKYVVREAAAARHAGRSTEAAQLTRTAAHGVLLLSIAVTLLLVAWSLLFGQPASGVVLVAVTIVPLAGLMRVRCAGLHAQSRVLGSQLPEMLVLPAAFLAFVLLREPTSPLVTVAGQAAALVAAVLFTLAIAPRRDENIAYGPIDRRTIGRWTQAALPFVLLAGLQAINMRADFVLLDALRSSTEVGHYAAANRFASLVPLSLLAVNATLTPRFAALRTAPDQLRRLATRGARIATAASLPLAIVLVVFPVSILSVMGDSFVAGRTPLIILTCGQLANVIMGSVGVLLLMTGHTRAALIGLSISAATNLLLDLVLIPSYGATGAAVASTVSLVVWNAVLTGMVARHLGIRIDAFGRSKA